MFLSYLNYKSGKHFIEIISQYEYNNVEKMGQWISRGMTKLTTIQVSDYSPEILRSHKKSQEKQALRPFRDISDLSGCIMSWQSMIDECQWEKKSQKMNISIITEKVTRYFVFNSYSKNKK